MLFLPLLGAFFVCEYVRLLFISLWKIWILTDDIFYTIILRKRTGEEKKRPATTTGAYISSQWPLQTFFFVSYLSFSSLLGLYQCVSGCEFKWLKFICNILIHMSYTWPVAQRESHTIHTIGWGNKPLDFCNEQNEYRFSVCSSLRTLTVHSPQWREYGRKRIGANINRSKRPATWMKVKISSSSNWKTEFL